MNTYEFKLPDLAEGTTEGEIAAWHVRVGDTIQEDARLVDVLTDKAVVEIPSPASGRVASLHAAVGEKLAVGSTLVVLQLAEESPQQAVSGGAADARVRIASEASTEMTRTEPIPAVPSNLVQRAAHASEAMVAACTDDRPIASPSVRRRAREAGISLTQIQGSGPDGRIVHADIDAALRGQATSSYPDLAPASPCTSGEPEPGVEQIPIVGMRRKIAERMAQSKRTIPHFSYVEEIDVTELESLRMHLNAQEASQHTKLTLLPFIMQAVARVLPAYPDINATFDTESSMLRRHAAIHIGIATQTKSGLLVPIVRNVQTRNLWQCASELARVTTAAREGRATRAELSGSTVTLTSLGALGGIAASPIINYPEVAIIGPNRIVERRWRASARSPYVR